MDNTPWMRDRPNASLQFNVHGHISTPRTGFELSIRVAWSSCPAFSQWTSLTPILILYFYSSLFCSVPFQCDEMEYINKPKEWKTGFRFPAAAYPWSFKVTTHCHLVQRLWTCGVARALCLDTGELNCTLPIRTSLNRIVLCNENWEKSKVEVKTCAGRHIDVSSYDSIGPITMATHTCIYITSLGLNCATQERRPTGCIKIQVLNCSLAYLTAAYELISRRGHRTKQNDGEKYIMRSFMMCTLH
jgi:hypothetical protein